MGTQTLHAAINFRATKLKFNEIALRVDNQGQMSPKFNHFCNTYSYQLTSISDSSFLVSVWTHGQTDGCK